jgi:hypothetical protein
MVTTYFLIGMIFIMYEAYVAMYPKEVLDTFRISRTQDAEGIEFNLFIGINLLYMPWIIVGLIFSTQTILFCIILLLSISSSVIKIRMNEKKKLFVIVLDAIASLCILSAIIYRHFYH